MENIEETTRKVLKGLRECAMGKEFTVGYSVCPYKDNMGKSCVSFMAQDAYSVITALDTTINAMMGNFGDACDVDGCQPEGGEG